MTTPTQLHCHSFADLPDMRAGGYVCIVHDRDDDGLSAYLSAKGFQVDRWTVAADAEDDAVTCSRHLHEATRLLVAVGGDAAMRTAKQEAYKAHVPLWCVPTHSGATEALHCRIFEVSEGIPRFVEGEPHTMIFLDALFHDDRGSVDLAYQALTAHYVGLITDVYRSRLTGENDEDVPRLTACAVATRETLLATTDRAPTRGQALWDGLSAASALSAPLEIELFAHAICLYKQLKMQYNRCRMAASAAIAACLGAWRDLPDLLTPSDRLTVREGIKTLGWQAPTVPLADYARAEWAWRDYLPDLQEALACMRLITKAWRRLLGAAGYDLALLTPQDLMALLPVAAELSPQYTPLKHLYLRGGLNAFI